MPLLLAQILLRGSGFQRICGPQWHLEAISFNDYLTSWTLVHTTISHRCFGGNINKKTRGKISVAATACPPGTKTSPAELRTFHIHKGCDLMPWPNWCHENSQQSEENHYFPLLQAPHSPILGLCLYQQANQQVQLFAFIVLINVLRYRNGLIHSGGSGSCICCRNHFGAFMFSVPSPLPSLGTLVMWPAFTDLKFNVVVSIMLPPSQKKAVIMVTVRFLVDNGTISTRQTTILRILVLRNFHSFNDTRQSGKSLGWLLHAQVSDTGNEDQCHSFSDQLMKMSMSCEDIVEDFSQQQKLVLKKFEPELC